MYEHIDMKKTGLLLKYRIEKAGYTVKDIQKILQLSCPQPIYRWFKGMILPSVDHLYVLSRLLKVHMEDLLVPQCESIRTQGNRRTAMSLLTAEGDVLAVAAADAVNAGYAFFG